MNKGKIVALVMGLGMALGLANSAMARPDCATAIRICEGNGLTGHALDKCIWDYSGIGHCEIR